MQIIYNKSK